MDRAVRALPPMTSLRILIGESGSAAHGRRGEADVADSLHDELIAIPGIEGAEIDGASGSPAGVRIRLSVGADADVVSREVQRVLATHGMRSQLTAPHIEPTEPPPPPGAPSRGSAAVVPLPAPQELEIPMPDPEPVVVHEPPVIVASAQPVALESVAIEEGRTGVVVRITTSDGDSVTHAADEGLDEAVVAAVAEATGAGEIRLVGVEESVLDGSSILMVVLELADRTRSAGSAVSEGGRAYGVARAAWMAITGQA